MIQHGVQSIALLQSRLLLLMKTLLQYKQHNNDHSITIGRSQNAYVIKLNTQGVEVNYIGRAYMV